MDNIIDVYADVVTTIICATVCFSFAGGCVAVYRYAVICFLESVMSK